MTNKFKTIVLSALCTSTLLAGGHSSKTVSIATDGTGDFLIAPFYEAKNDVCSEVKVFNTNERIKFFVRTKQKPAQSMCTYKILLLSL